MPVLVVHRSIAVERTPRVMQLEGLFDIPPARRRERTWRAMLPLEARPWNIGLIVGPSGSGKSTLARELFGPAVIDGFVWPERQSLIDAFPAAMSIVEITQLLSSVGFSSPPGWVCPFHVLSQGEQFRATLARALAEHRDLAVIDEFTSVVDRTVARLGSAAVAKAVRGRQGRFVAVGCHYDVIDWLQPDWTYEPANDQFQWRLLRQRPDLPLEIRRVSPNAWDLFHRHHYLNGDLNRAAKCFLGLVALPGDDAARAVPCAFTAVLPFPHARRPGWREHRTVCLPDYQGVGIGNALSEFVAGVFRSTGKPYFSTTGNPAMLRHRARSSLWKQTRNVSLSAVRRSSRGLKKLRRSAACDRLTASFEYVGPPLAGAARALGVVR